jgi:hypothetical protein
MSLYDNKGKKTRVTSNYAISYKVTGIIDLQGKVKLFLRKDRPLKRSNCTTIKKMSGFTEKVKFTDEKDLQTDKG